MQRTRLATRLKYFWRERVVILLINQLKQGVSPQQIALTITLGICISAFPIVGTTSVICFFVGLWFGLNQPIIQLVNWLASPLQLGLFAVFVRLGEKLALAPHMSFSIPDMFAKFKASPAGFFREFGLTGLHGIIGWAVVVPFAGVLIYFLFLPMTKKLAKAQQPVEPAHDD